MKEKLNNKGNKLAKLLVFLILFLGFFSFSTSSTNSSSVQKSTQTELLLKSRKNSSRRTFTYRGIPALSQGSGLISNSAKAKAFALVAYNELIKTALKFISSEYIPILQSGYSFLFRNNIQTDDKEIPAPTSL